RERDEMPIIIMTGHANVPKSVRAMKAGAVEFLMKPVDDQILLAAIGAALERSRAAVDGKAVLQTLRSRWASLTRREQEVMKLVVAGRLNKQIAGDLAIAEVTVKKHRGCVMQKMGVRSVTDLVRISASLG